MAPNPGYLSRSAKQARQNELLGATSAAEVVVAPGGNDSDCQCDQSHALDLQLGQQYPATQSREQQAGRNDH